MQCKRFYGTSLQKKLPSHVPNFPVQQPDLSEDSNLSDDSDEQFTRSETKSK